MQIPISKLALRVWLFGLRPRQRYGSLRLARRRVFSTRLRVDCRISCSSGCVWITGGSDQRDIILQAGEAIQLGCRAKLVVESIEDAVVSIEPVSRPKEKRLNWSNARLYHL